MTTRLVAQFLPHPPPCHPANKKGTEHPENPALTAAASL